MSTIEQDLRALIARAAAEGHVATISLLSAWPPAMGTYSMVGEVRPARGAALSSPPPEPKTVGGGLTEERIIAAARNRDLLGPERASESDLIYFARDIAAMAAAPAPALKGRAAIVEAWNNLNHAVRLLPGLDALYRACLACDDATPSQDLTPGGSGEAIITEAEAAKSGERIAWLRERLDTPEKRRNWRAAQATPSADVPAVAGQAEPEPLVKFRKPANRDEAIVLLRMASGLVDEINAQFGALLAHPKPAVPPATQIDPAPVYSLLRRSLAQLTKWQRKYGEHDPKWLPPDGDVRLAEDIDAMLNQVPKPAAHEGEREALQLRALRMADMQLAAWENGYAFDSHGPSREAQRLVTEALAQSPQPPVSKYDQLFLDRGMTPPTKAVQAEPMTSCDACHAIVRTSEIDAHWKTHTKAGQEVSDDLKDRIADMAINHRDAEVRAFACEVHDILALRSGASAQPADALRYQWLRANYVPPKDGEYEFDSMDRAFETGGDELDAAIDAKIAKATAAQIAEGGAKP